MPERVDSGLYRTGTRKLDRYDNWGRVTTRTTIYVVKGEKANDSRAFGLSQHTGMKSSRWYVFESVELHADERESHGGRCVNVADFRDDEFTTKKEAVNHAQTLAD